MNFDEILDLTADVFPFHNIFDLYPDPLQTLPPAAALTTGDMTDMLACRIVLALNSFPCIPYSHTVVSALRAAPRTLLHCTNHPPAFCCMNDHQCQAVVLIGSCVGAPSPHSFLVLFSRVCTAPHVFSAYRYATRRDSKMYFEVLSLSSSVELGQGICSV